MIVINEGSSSWFEVVSAVGSIATAIGVLVALTAFVLDRGKIRREIQKSNEAAVTEQARRIYHSTKMTGFSQGEGWWSIDVLIENRSDAPVFGITVEPAGNWNWATSEMHEVAPVWELLPGKQVVVPQLGWNRADDVDFDTRANYAISFTDARGTRFRRERDGLLKNLGLETTPVQMKAGPAAWGTKKAPTSAPKS